MQKLKNCIKPAKSVFAVKNVSWCGAHIRLQEVLFPLEGVFECV